MLGKTPSLRQIQILKNALGRGTGVLLLDSDAGADASAFEAEYGGTRVFDEGLHVVRLPEGDPADLSREALWDLILSGISGYPENQGRGG